MKAWSIDPTHFQSARFQSRDIPTGASVEELHRTRLQVVHRAGHLDPALRFHFSKHGALLSDFSNAHLNVLSRDSVDEGIVLRRTLARIGSRLYRGFDLGQQSSQIAQLGIVDCALDGAACRVAHYKHHFRTCQFARELHAAQNVRVSNVTGNPTVKNVANSKVHDDLS